MSDPEGDPASAGSTKRPAAAAQEQASSAAAQQNSGASRSEGGVAAGQVDAAESDTAKAARGAHEAGTDSAAERDRSAAELRAAAHDAAEPEADRAQALSDLRAAADDADAAEAAAAQAEADARAAETDAASAGRRPIGAVVLLAVAAAALWGSSRMTWASLEITSDYGLPRTKDLDGGVWFGALTPLALVFLATIAAVFATHGWARRGIGVVVAVLAAVAAVPGYAVLVGRGNTAERAARLAELHGGDHAGAVTTSTLPAVLSLAGAVAAFLAGLLLVRTSSTAAKMSGKYDNPAKRKLSAAEQVAEHHVRSQQAEYGSPQGGEQQLSGRVLWDALDEGVDPTDIETNTPAAHDDPGSGDAGHHAR
ncbi:TIGR02234 family membrane protein [Nocardia yamanashiensis]|uniref:TIGR02234 family membrane protein n=1 Tax=Nocardia yamanashiensis TaxID=209247 RepID=UPI001E3730B0|nr:TIGR02234 family membrane protein [Nocardia yamanashiensis]UGT41130.1 TIGR02234 family membrane protein [Nocardia yamanashiensis]